MDSESETDAPNSTVETVEPVKPTKSKEKVVVHSDIKIKRRKPLSDESKAKLAVNRQKGLEKLSQLRRERAAMKEQTKKDIAEAKQIVEDKKLDKAPKVREIDGTVAALRAEMEALKKQLAESKKAEVKEVADTPKKKVKKIVYEEEEDDVEEVVEVVKRKSAPKNKALSGSELLDALFFKNQ